MAGIAAARAAGMKVIGVPTTYPAEKLGAAHQVVPALAGLDRGRAATRSSPDGDRWRPAWDPGRRRPPLPGRRLDAASASPWACAARRSRARRRAAAEGRAPRGRRDPSRRATSGSSWTTADAFRGRAAASRRPRSTGARLLLSGGASAGFARPGVTLPAAAPGRANTRAASAGTWSLYLARRLDATVALRDAARGRQPRHGAPRVRGAVAALLSSVSRCRDTHRQAHEQLRAPKGHRRRRAADLVRNASREALLEAARAPLPRAGTRRPASPADRESRACPPPPRRALQVRQRCTSLISRRSSPIGTTADRGHRTAQPL